MQHLFIWISVCNRRQGDGSSVTKITKKVLPEGTEKVHFFQNTNIVIKKRASRIASKAPFLLDDTLSTPKIFSFFVEDYFFSSLEPSLRFPGSSSLPSSYNNFKGHFREVFQWAILLERNPALTFMLRM